MNIPTLAALLLAVAIGQTALAAPPEIDDQPQSVDACVGENVTFEVTLVGAGAYEYQWRWNGVAIFGANDSIYQIPNVGFGAEGDYDVVVSIGDEETFSDTAILTVSEAIAITTHPQDADACVGEPVVFEVAISHPDAADYQWMYGGVEIPGAVTATYEIPSAELADAGEYSVRVFNLCRELVSDAAELNVADVAPITVQPQNLRVCDGAPAEFTVEVDPAFGPYDYQWRRDGAPIFGAVDPIYTVDAAGMDAGALYDCVVTNECGDATSDAALLTVAQAPNILTQPESEEVCENDSVTFEVEVEAVGDVHYQWRLYGVDLPGEVNATLEIASVDLSHNNGVYNCIVTDDCGEVQSESVLLKVWTVPQINVQPSDVTTCQGETAQFTVEAVGSDSMTYEWRRLGEPTPVHVGQTLTLNNVQPEDGGLYQVTVTNECGFVTSNLAELDVRIVPHITPQFYERTVCVGYSFVTFTVDVEGADEDTTYTWYLNGHELPGYDTNSITISPVESEDFGGYSIRVENNCGHDERIVALLEVVPYEPEFTIQPLGVKLCGDGSESITLTSRAVPLVGLEYQWRKDGVDIPGATHANYTINNVQMMHEGEYQVACTNPCRSVGDPVLSNVAFLDVISDQITLAPLAQPAPVCDGGRVEFTIEAEGEDLEYQWYRLGDVYEPIPDGDDSSLVIDPVTIEDGDYLYRVEVTNICGTTKYSTNVGLNVVPDTLTVDLDPTNAEICGDAGESITFEAHAAPGTGLVYQWRKDGVDIEGAHGPSYTINDVSEENEGEYDVVCTNPCNGPDSPVVSDPAMLIVNAAAEIVQRPLDQSPCEFDGVTFEVMATGTEPIEYQWYKDDAPIEGATADTYTIESVDPADTGAYWVEITNSCGTDSSQNNPALLEISVGPSIIEPPSLPEHACPGDPLTLSVVAEGSGELRYKWYKDGEAILGAESATYEIAELDLEHSGRYHVVVENDCQVYATDPNDLNLFVETPVYINEQGQPQDVIIIRDHPHTFRVEPSGTSDFTYEWFKDDSKIEGADQDYYETDEDGVYKCRVSNACGQTWSRAAQLKIATRLTVAASASALGIRIGGQVAVTATADRGEPPYTYLWNTGATTPTFNVALTEDTTFTVQAADSLGQTAVSQVKIVVAAPLKTQARASAYNLLLGESSVLTASVISGGLVPFTYEWNTGETTQSILVTPAEETTYLCTVTDALGQTDVATVTLSTYEEPEAADDDQAGQDQPDDNNQQGDDPNQNDPNQNDPNQNDPNDQNQNQQNAAGLCPLTGFGMITMLFAGLCWSRRRR